MNTELAMNGSNGLNGVVENGAVANGTISNGSKANGSISNGSILTTANLHIIDDISIPHHDSVQISMELFLRLFPHVNKSAVDSHSHYVMVKFLGAPDYFDHFKLYKVNAINHNDPTNNSITFVNDSVLAQFQGQLTITTALVQSVAAKDIPNIENLFVAVPPEIYSILKDKSHAYLRRQFIDNYLVHNGSLVNQGDLIRPINGEIILCEPINQGMVTLDTNIYIIKAESETEDTEAEIEEEDLDVETHISNYLSSSLNIEDLDDVTHPEFKVSTLPNNMYMNNLPIMWTKEDRELFIFINTNDLIKFQFPVFNGDSVMLNCGEKKVVVKIFTVIEPNKSFEPGNIYISPILAINLQLKKGDLVVVEPVKNKQLQLSSVVPVAKSVAISRIASPVTLDKTYQQHFFSALKTSFNSYFKIMRPDDVVPVVIDSILSKTMFDLANDNTNLGIEDEINTIPTGDPDSVAWFKINEISGDEESSTGQYFIDPLKTRMILSGVEFAPLPENSENNWYDYLALPPIFNYNQAILNNPSNANDETSVFNYARVLKKILLTNINSKINLKTSILLNSMTRSLGKTTVIRNLSTELGLNLIELDCINYINPGSELKTIGLLTGQIDKLLNHDDNTSDNSFNVIYLKHIESLCTEINENEQGSNISTSLSLKVAQLLQGYFNERKNVIIVMSCNDIDKLNNNIRLMVKFQIDFNVPSELERQEIFKFLINNELKAPKSPYIPELYEDLAQFESGTKNTEVDLSEYKIDIRSDINFKSLALQSAGLTPKDLISIFKKAKTIGIKRLTSLTEKLSLSLEKILKIGNGSVITLIPEDFNTAINEARNQYSDSIGAPRIPNVKWEDIGGLDVVKDEILDTIDMPLKHPELFNNGLKKRSGILFYGPPGTGKTLLAKAIATNFSLNFFSVKGPELLNMYIGESEANVRRVFQKARDAKPCVIFFDELDSVAPKRGNQGDSGGVMDRIVSQLLAELDGMSGGGGNSGDGLFVVGATNRPDLLDEALLRPGRFDKMLYLGISDTNDKQVKILEALTRKFKLHDQVDLDIIAEKCSFTFTGADFYALCSDSMLNAMTRIATEVDGKIKSYNQALVETGKQEVSTRWWFDNVAGEGDTEVVVKMEDFVKAQNELVPSVSADELNHYLKIRENFEGGKKAANGNGSQNGPQQNGPQQNGSGPDGFVAEMDPIESITGPNGPIDVNGAAINDFINSISSTH